MRPFRLAAATLGAIIAVSCTLGAAYRTDGLVPMDDPTTSSTTPSDTTPSPTTPSPTTPSGDPSGDRGTPTPSHFSSPQSFQQQGSQGDEGNDGNDGDGDDGPPAVVPPVACVAASGWATEDTAPTQTTAGLKFAGPSATAVDSYQRVTAGNMQGLAGMTYTIAAGTTGQPAQLVVEVDPHQALNPGGPTLSYATISTNLPAGASGVIDAQNLTGASAWSSTKITSGPGSLGHPISWTQMIALMPNNVLLSAPSLHLLSNSTAGDVSTVRSVSSSCGSTSFIPPTIPCVAVGGWTAEDGDAGPVQTITGLRFAGPSAAAVDSYQRVSGGNMQGITGMTYTIAAGESGQPAQLVVEVDPHRPLNSGGPTIDYATISTNLPAGTSGVIDAQNLAGASAWSTTKITSGPGSLSQPISWAQMIELMPSNTLLSAPSLHLLTHSTAGDSSMVSSVSSSCGTTSFVPSLPSGSAQFQPGGVTISAAPTGDSSGTAIQLFSWTGSHFTEFRADAWCPQQDGETEAFTATNPNACSFGSLGAGDYEISAYQEGSDFGYLRSFTVPATPTITKTTLAGGNTVTLTGTGVAGDLITVVVDGTGIGCDAIPVSDAGTWTCTTAQLAVGSHSFSAYLTDTGSGDPSIPLSTQLTTADHLTGGLSALSNPAATLSVPSAGGGSSTPPSLRGFSLTTLATWSFTVTGEDLNNVHPGDHFTVSGSGLPPGAVVSGELHSKVVLLGSVTVGADGTFTLPIVVPMDFAPGSHELIMTLTPAGLSPIVARSPLTVVAGTSSSTDSGSASEGSTSGSTSGGRLNGLPGQSDASPNILTHGLNSIADVLAHPAKIPAAIEIGLVLLIFAILPGHLLNATLAEQYERFRKRVPSRRRRVPAWWARLHAAMRRAPFVAGVALTTITALLFGFADPRFGFTLASLRLFLGLAIALAVVTYLTNVVVGRIMRGRWKVDVEVSLRPLGLILTVAGVVVSRVLDFTPGFLVGLVLGLVISEKQLAKHAWRAVLLRASILLGLALLAWLGFSLFDSQHEGGTFASELAVETLVAITTEAVVGLLVELLPLRLLEGERLYQRSKVLWGALYLVAVFIFVVAVVPWEGNWAELGTSLWAWLGIVVGFGIIATGTYIYFRVRTHDEVDQHDDRDQSADGMVPIGSEDDAP